MSFDNFLVGRFLIQINVESISNDDSTLKSIKIYMVLSELYLIYPHLNFSFICWNEFLLNLFFCGKNFCFIHNVKNNEMEFSARCLDLEFLSFKIFGAIFTILRLLFELRNIFDGFFLVYCRGGGEQLSSWWFLIAIYLLVAFTLWCESDESS